MLKHGLENAGFALDAGRSRTHSLDVSPEAFGEQAARWTYAVLIAALLNGIAAALDRQRITIRQRGGQTKAWSPRQGSMADAGAIGYQVEFVDGGGLGSDRSRFGAFLVERLVPGAKLAWQSADANVMRDLVALLSSDSETAHSRLAEVVRRADAESARRNLLTGSRVRFASARGVPLIKRLMAALRVVVADPAQMPFSGPDTAGWVRDGDAWLDADRLLNAMRLQFQTDPTGASAIPADDEIVQTWAAYGALMLNLLSGAARWNSIVGEGDDRQPRTLLRFPLRLLFAEPSAWPAPGDWTIDPDLQNSDRPGASAGTSNTPSGCTRPACRRSSPSSMSGCFTGWKPSFETRQRIPPPPAATPRYTVSSPRSPRSG